MFDSVNVIACYWANCNVVIFGGTQCILRDWINDWVNDQNSSINHNSNSNGCCDCAHIAELGNWASLLGHIKDYQLLLHWRRRLYGRHGKCCASFRSIREYFYFYF